MCCVSFSFFYFSVWHIGLLMHLSLWWKEATSPPGRLEEKWLKDQKGFLLLRRLCLFISEGTAFLGTSMYISLARSIHMVTSTSKGSWRSSFSCQASLEGCGKGLLNEPIYSNCHSTHVNNNKLQNGIRGAQLKRGQGDNEIDQ